MPAFLYWGIIFMKQAIEGILKYLRKNYCSYWIILGIDTVIAVLCTWIAYIGIYSMAGISVRTDIFYKIIGISFISCILGSYTVSYTHLTLPTN